MGPLQFHVLRVLVSMSRSETSLLKLKIVFLFGLLYLKQIIGGY